MELLNGSVGDFFRTTTKVRQGCQLSQVLFDIFLERITQKALTPPHPSENDCFEGDAAEGADETDILLSSMSIGGRRLCNLRFADNIDLLGGSEEERQRLCERPEKTAAGYGM